MAEHDLDGMTMAAAAERDHRAECYAQLLAACKAAFGWFGAAYPELLANR